VKQRVKQRAKQRVKQRVKWWSGMGAAEAMGASVAKQWIEQGAKERVK